MPLRSRVVAALVLAVALAGLWQASLALQREIRLLAGDRELRAGAAAQALADANRVLQRAPAEPRALTLRALANERLGRSLHAHDDWQSLARAVPADPRAWLYLARWNLRQEPVSPELDAALLQALRRGPEEASRIRSFAQWALEPSADRVAPMLRQVLQADLVRSYRAQPDAVSGYALTRRREAVLCELMTGQGDPPWWCGSVARERARCDAPTAEAAVREACAAAAARWLRNAEAFL